MNDDGAPERNLYVVEGRRTLHNRHQHPHKSIEKEQYPANNKVVRTAAISKLPPRQHGARLQQTRHVGSRRSHGRTCSVGRTSCLYVLGSRVGT